MSFEIQQKIRQNALEMREYVTDLYDWEQEMELKEKARASFRQQERQKNEQAFQQAKEQEARIAKEQEQARKEEAARKKMQQGPKVDLVRDANTIKDYYSAWDKFDVDKELTALQAEEERAYRPYNPYEDSRNNQRAKPKTKVTIKGRRNVVSDPSELKDRGNLHFQSLQFEKAINCYSECLKRLGEGNQQLEQLSEDQRKLWCVVLSNRAMAHLKNQETAKALEDATESLRYNPNYAKSYYRRAECLKKLGRYKQSLRDFRMVRSLEPGETKAEAEIKKIEAFLAKRARQTRQSMVIEHNPSLMLGSRRIEIGQVEQFQAQAEKGGSNYLDEL